MGMFDYLRCEYPLPGTSMSAEERHELQTKSLTKWLRHYIIAADGALYLDLKQAVDFDLSEMDYARNVGWHDESGQLRMSEGQEETFALDTARHLESFLGCRPQPEGTKPGDRWPLAYTGEIRFRGDGGVYRIRYDDGRLVEIVCDPE